MIEDRDSEAESLVESGIHTFLVDRPYNQGDTKAVRVKNLIEIDKELLNVL